MRKAEFAYPPRSPRDTLKGVFERMKRAARTEMFARMSERLAPPSNEARRIGPLRTEYPSFAFASEFEPSLRPAAEVLRPSEVIRISGLDKPKRRVGE